MTVSLITTIQRWAGFSTDVKPTDAKEGATFHAVDTGEEYVYHDGVWVQDMRRINAIKAAAI